MGICSGRFRASPTFTWWWRWRSQALSQHQWSTRLFRKAISCLQLFPSTVLSVPTARRQSKSMLWFRYANFMLNFYLLFHFVVLLVVLQCLWSTGWSFNSAAVWDGEGDAAAHEGDHTAHSWAAPLPPSRAQRTGDGHLSSRSAW